MPEATALSRHDLVRVEAAAFAAWRATRPDLDRLPHLANWALRGRPLIVRRGDGDPSGGVPLGLPLPPSAGRARIALALPGEALDPLPPPSLADCRATAPTAWRPSLDRLVGLGERLGLVPRPFGSLLWAHLTGLDYLGPASDLDLLWPLPGAIVPDGLLDGLARIAAEAPMTLDGEVVLADGAGIHWRELHAGPPDGLVLAKLTTRLEWRGAAALRADPA